MEWGRTTLALSARTAISGLLPSAAVTACLKVKSIGIERLREYHFQYDIRATLETCDIWNISRDALWEGGILGATKDVIIRKRGRERERAGGRDDEGEMPEIPIAWRNNYGALLPPKDFN